MRLGGLGLALGLVLGLAAPAFPQEKSRVQVALTNRRDFKIPFNINPADRPRYKQIQLVASSDSGGHWEIIDSTTPDRPSFRFKAPRDGEYWFAVRTLDTKNRLSPPDDAEIEPNMKVVVDTVLPIIHLEALPRRGSTVAVRWDLIDDRIDLSSLKLEFQVVGSPEWNSVTLRKPSRISSESWDAGTSEPIRVRMSVLDKAENARSVVVTMADGKPRNRASSDAGDGSDGELPPPRGTFASAEAERTGPSPILSGPPNMPGVGEGRPERTDSSGPVGTYNPFGSSDPAGTRAATTSPAPAASPGAESSNPPILVSNPKFGLKYEVDDAGPNGPAAVELYITTDGGRNWFKRGEDPDRASPFPVDLGGEGTFGLKLVCKSSANQGDLPPTSGEIPQTIVEVDSSGPVVKLDPIRVVGSKALITWHANDPHPAPRSVMISVKPDVPDAPWVPILPAPIENTGQFTCVLPANCPPRLHFRVDVSDSLGNRGSAETIETGAVLVDRSKPKGRITGLDAGLREGTGPSVRPIR